ncbi:aquaporin-like protein [Aspergillus pseudonomiae]|uniref:Aquaporin-like protein n=1 Tax=Aspergillus pseudonomiae TaxID=1506151 RepID=A0A5N7DQI9_9EURO|nr:aquaporin-like protein [Aspergillus pseudonomiae]KAE8408656.1 aquaporin-like protein [Aspergillus pseudonomiae]
MAPHANFWHSEPETLPTPKEPPPFAGRIGANQQFSLEKNNCTDTAILEKYPDAAPWVPWRNSLSPKQFLELGLWKAAAIEGVGTCLLVYLTILFPMGLAQNMNNLATGPVVPTLIGSLVVMFMLPLFIYAVGPVSGAHLNPMISLAAFFGRLMTFPRCVLYVAFQIFGAAIAGWLVRASLDTRSFMVPGCYMDVNQVSAGSAFVIEFVTDVALIFLAFGIGLDPRQRVVFGPTLGPIFVGIVLGVCIFSTGIIRPGYTGFSGHPARCFGAMVGSHFASYHWIQWIAPLCASVTHGLLYYFIQPYERK